MTIKAIVAAAALGLVAAGTAAQAAPGGIGGIGGDVGLQAHVEKAHGFHCDPRYTRREGWHRHWEACLRQFPKFGRDHDHWRHDRFRHKRHGEPRWR